MRLRQWLAAPALDELRARLDTLDDQQVKLAHALAELFAALENDAKEAQRSRLAVGDLVWRELREMAEAHQRLSDEQRAASRVLFDQVEAAREDVAAMLEGARATFASGSEELSTLLRREFLNQRRDQLSMVDAHQALGEGIRDALANLNRAQEELAALVRLAAKQAHQERAESRTERHRALEGQASSRQALDAMQAELLGHLQSQAREHADRADRMSEEQGASAQLLKSGIEGIAAAQRSMGELQESLRKLQQEGQASSLQALEAMRAEFLAKLQSQAREHADRADRIAEKQGASVGLLKSEIGGIAAAQRSLGEIQESIRKLQAAQSKEMLETHAALLGNHEAALRFLREESGHVRSAVTKEAGKMLALHESTLAAQREIGSRLQAQLGAIERNGLGFAATQESAVASVLGEAARLMAEQETFLRSQEGLNAKIEEYRREESLALDAILSYSNAAARRVAIPCGDDEVMVKTAAGYVICAASDHALLACLIDTGDLERGTRLLIERLVKPGCVFIDVGANVGLHTLAAARSMQGKGTIIAFEPFEKTCRMLKESVWMNGFSSMVEVRQAAVADRPGNRPLFLGLASGHHSLFPLEASVSAGGTQPKVKVEVLDSLIRAIPSVDLIKIDVEGAELEVVKGAEALISRSPRVALIVEFGISHLRRRRMATKKWLASFKDLGLEFRAIDALSGRLEKWSIAQLESVESVNLLFAKPRSEVWSEPEQVPQ